MDRNLNRGNKECKCRRTGYIHRLVSGAVVSNTHLRSSRRPLSPRWDKAGFSWIKAWRLACESKHTPSQTRKHSFGQMCVFSQHSKAMRVFSSGHLVLAGLVQYVQGLHGHGLAVVVELRDQQLHAPAAEELHAGTQQHAEVFGGIQPARLLSKTRSIAGERGNIRMRPTELEDAFSLNSTFLFVCLFVCMSQPLTSVAAVRILERMTLARPSLL